MATVLEITVGHRTLSECPTNFEICSYTDIRELFSVTTSRNQTFYTAALIFWKEKGKKSSWVANHEQRNVKETSSDGDGVQNWESSEPAVLSAIVCTKSNINERGPDELRNGNWWTNGYQNWDVGSFKKRLRVSWDTFKNNFERITTGVFVTLSHFLAFFVCFPSLHTHRFIMCLDEASCVVRCSRHISRDTSYRRIMHHVPVHILKTHNYTNIKSLPKFVQTTNARVLSVKTANISLHTVIKPYAKSSKAYKIIFLYKYWNLLAGQSQCLYHKKEIFITNEILAFTNDIFGKRFSLLLIFLCFLTVFFLFPPKKWGAKAPPAPPPARSLNRHFWRCVLQHAKRQVNFSCFKPCVVRVLYLLPLSVFYFL